MQGTQKSGVLLIVEDDSGVARALERLAGALVKTVIAGTIADAEALSAEAGSALRGAVIDIELPDGSGLDFAETLRNRHPALPILILTGQISPDLINRAHMLVADYVCKPNFTGNVRQFILRLASAAASELTDGPVAITEAIARLATVHHLSPRETQILSIVAHGIPRARLAEVLGVSENTIKSQIRSLLHKTSQSNLSDLVWLLRSGMPDPSGA